MSLLRPFLGTSAALLAVALASACAVGPDFAPPPVRTPGSFAAATAADGTFSSGTPVDGWWLVLADENLTALLERAVNGANLDLRAARERVLQARAELGIAGAAELPSVDVQASVSRDRFSRNSELLANLPLPNPQLQFTDFRAGFDASWEIDFFGHTRRAIEAAAARVEGAQARWSDLRLTVAGDVARTYVQLRRSERLIALASDDLAGLEERARLVQLRQAAGNASADERHQAQAAVEAQRATVEDLVAQAAVLRSALAVLVGVTTQELDGLLVPGLPVPAVPSERIAVGLPSELLRRRPDIVAAERTLASATADIGAATADLYPRFSLVGNLGADSISAGEFGRSASRSWSLGPQLQLPLLGRGRLTEQVKAREAARDAALAQYRQSVLAALGDVESAMARFARARDRAAALQRAANEIEASAELVRAQFAAGRASRLDVLNAEQQARDASAQAVAAQADLAIQLVALCKALGGGWSDAPASDTRS